MKPLRAGQPLAEGYTLSGPLEPIGEYMTVTASHEMVERVSAAIRLSDYSHLPARAIAREIARVAIEAMREPTEAMIDAANNSKYECSEGINLDRLIEREGIKIVYRAAIDAALNPV